MTPAAPPAASPAPLTQTLEVETPELVLVHYTVAGLGSRAFAAIIDYLICIGSLVVLVFVFGLRSALSARIAGGTVVVAMTILILAQFAVLWGYYVLFEALADGQTPGKRLQHLRVVRDGGYSVTFGASAIRNLVRLLDMQPVLTYGVGMTSVLISRSGKRLGDYAAGTLVVREGVVRAPAAAGGGPPPAEEAPALHTRLTEDEFAVLERFVERSRELDAAPRLRLASQLAARFAGALAEIPGADGGQRLERLLAAERGARSRGLASREDTGAARERHAIVAAGSTRWSAFAARLAEAQRRGLKGLGEAGVRDFVREYRDVAADLARLSTAARGRAADELFYLNRLVAGAHNLLYRRREIPLRDAARYLFRDVPRETRRSARPIALAAVLLFLPAAIAGTGVYRTPETARALLPPAMLDRAEDGVARAKSGEGYIPDPQIFRPVMASAIVTNNVQVTFAAFALGLTAGLGTAWLLVANGISVGAVTGLYASKGIAPLLFAFVAPHGVLELTAICIAGGAGFLLAAALLVPGARTRREALVENGARAIRLIAGSSLLLVVAGTLEGFVSPIEWWPLAVKLAVSGVTVVLLVEYLRLGRTPLAPPEAGSERAAALDLEVSVHDAGGHGVRGEV
jgi:uncharacterized membrane protein SpoIIM required for sporulation/uncharacterized RDD family membrane protein YckC